MIAVLPFVLKYWRLILGGLALAALGIALFLAKADARHWKKQAAQAKAAFDTTVANYRAAAAVAAQRDAENVVRVKDEQTKITERVSHDYETKLADTASRYDRLRAQASGYLSRPDPAGVPASRDATCQAVTGTRCEELPALLRAAQDNTDQLLALQDWVRAQSSVDTGGTKATP